MKRNEIILLITVILAIIILGVYGSEDLNSNYIVTLDGSLNKTVNGLELTAYFNIDDRKKNYIPIFFN